MGLMPAKRRKKRKPVDDDDLPNPGERQRARFPDWWLTTDQAELKKAHLRGRQLIDFGVDGITWDELLGKR